MLSRFKILIRNIKEYFFVVEEIIHFKTMKSVYTYYYIYNIYEGTGYILETLSLYCEKLKKIYWRSGLYTKKLPAFDPYCFKNNNLMVLTIHNMPKEDFYTIYNRDKG